MSIAITIRVTGNPVEYEYDIQIYTHVQRDYIYYRQEVKSNEIQLAYLETLPILSHEAIELNSYLENIIPPIDTTVYSTKENVVYSEKSNLIFTTVTAPESYGKKPLFFCHKIKGKASNVSFIPWKNGIDSSNWIYLEKYNAIFSDLMNDLDSEIGRYNANYVQYTTASGSIYAQSGQSIKEIYKREPLFSEQTVFDYDEETLEINENAPVYYKSQELNGQWKYQFIKPVNETLYYTEYRQAKLSARMNPGLPLNYSWPIEIIGSSLTMKSEQGPNITYNWTNPDADRWFPYYPYLTLKKQAYYVNRTSFQVLNSHIVLNPSESIHLTFKVYRYSESSKDYNLLFAQSTDIAYVGKKISGNYIDNNIIKYTKFTGSVDYSLGIVTISDQVPLNPRDKIIAEYVVKEEESEYNFYNVNPLHNKKVLDGYLFFFATPKTESENSKIYWAWIKDRYNDEISAYSEYVYDTNYPNKSLILGLFVSDFKDMCTYNFIESYVPSSFTSNMQFLPICSASFKKKKYTEFSSIKDLRVLGALKEDYEIEKKNKNAVFSNILNASGFINVDSSSQVFVYIDKDQSFYPDSLDDLNFKNIINQNLPVTLVGHQKSISYVDISYLHIKGRTESEEQILTINMEVLHKGNRLAVYVVDNPNGVSSKDILLTTLDVVDYSESNAELESNGTVRYTKEVNLVPESATSTTLNDTVKDFIYLAFESYQYDLATGEETLLGPRSQVSCYYIDRSL